MFSVATRSAGFVSVIDVVVANPIQSICDRPVVALCDVDVPNRIDVQSTSIILLRATP
jgi:hypothetical protein